MNITFLESLKRVGNYIHIFPALNMGRRDIWDNTVHETIDGIERPVKMTDMFPAEFVVDKNEAEMKYEFMNGSSWQIMGADDAAAIDRMRGPNPIGIVCSEYAFTNPLVWKTLQPVLLENDGWIAFISTPNMEGDHFEQLCEFAQYDPEWFFQVQTVDDTRRDGEGESSEPVITKAKIEEIRKEPGVREEEVQREYYCNVKGYRHGTIYGDLYTAAEISGRIGPVPYIVNIPVGIAWDLGTADIMCMWFFQCPDPYRIHFIDYYADSLKGLDFFDNVIRSRPYTIGGMRFPHDGQHAATFFWARGYRNLLVAQRPKFLWPAIDEVRRMWPQFYFDQNKCKIGLDGLKNYKRKWDPNKMIYIDEPVHDVHSHPADGVRSGVACGFGPLEWFENAGQPIKVESTFDPREIGSSTPGPFSR